MIVASDFVLARFALPARGAVREPPVHLDLGCGDLRPPQPACSCTEEARKTPPLQANGLLLTLYALEVASSSRAQLRQIAVAEGHKRHRPECQHDKRKVA